MDEPCSIEWDELVDDDFNEQKEHAEALEAMGMSVTSEP